MKTLRVAETQIISLVQALLDLSRGVVDSRQKFNQEYSSNDNFDLYKSLVGVNGTNCFGNFDPNKLYNALLTSKALTTLNIVERTEEMMRSLPIGFPEGHLVCYLEQRA